MISLANRDGNKNFYNDFSSGKAIQDLKNKHDFIPIKINSMITKNEMMSTIIKGISDKDNQSASNEYIDFKKFVTDNSYRMSPEARGVFAVYEKYVQRAQSQGRTGLNLFEMKQMYNEMKNSNATDFAFNQIVGSTLPDYNIIPGGNTPPPSNNGYVPSFPGSNLVGQAPAWTGVEGIAANETATVWGDPHFVDPDGGRFDVQGQAGKTYNMLDDSGLNFNARFDDAGNGTTVIGQTGITIRGLGGSSQIQFSKDGIASINGQTLQRGVLMTLADGGHALLSDDGKTLTIKNNEGYNITQRLVDGRIDADVKSPEYGVARDGRMPGGLLGQTFDADKIARNSSGHQGEGAIAGSVNNYEVPGGVFGFNNPSISPAPFSNFSTGSQMLSEQELRNQSLNFAVSQNQRTQQQQSINDSNSKIDKIMQQLLAALQSGNIDMAMLLFSQLEGKQSAQMTGMLTQKLVEFQQTRKQMMTQMDQKGGDQKQLNTMQANVQEVNDSIQVLTSFIKDINEQKNRISEFANNYLSAEHQTSMSIVRGMR